MTIFRIIFTIIFQERKVSKINASDHEYKKSSPDMVPE